MRKGHPPKPGEEESSRQNISRQRSELRVVMRQEEIPMLVVQNEGAGTLHMCVRSHVLSVKMGQE